MVSTIRRSSGLKYMSKESEKSFRWRACASGREIHHQVLPRARCCDGLAHAHIEGFRFFGSIHPRLHIKQTKRPDTTSSGSVQMRLAKNTPRVHGDKSSKKNHLPTARRYTKLRPKKNEKQYYPRCVGTCKDGKESSFYRLTEKENLRFQLR